MRFMSFALLSVLLLAQSAPGQTLSLRLDLAGTARLVVFHPTLLSGDDYGATYVLDVPAEQTATFVRATPQAEFEQIVVETEHGEIREVRTSKVGEPSALIIRPGTADLTAAWDLPVYISIPPAPTAAEVRRRFALAAGLFVKAQEALGLKDFKGGETGTIAVNLAGVEDLSLRSRATGAVYDYTFFALGHENMVEELKVEAAAGTWTVEVGPESVTVQQEATTPDGQRVVLELMLTGTAWQGSRTAQRPGERPAAGELARPEAERLLAEGLAHLRDARRHFSITFGRDLAAHRLP